MDILLSPSLGTLAFVKTNYIMRGSQNDVIPHFKFNCSEKSNFGAFRLKEKLFLKAYLFHYTELEHFISKRSLNSAVHTAYNTLDFWRSKFFQ